MLPWKCMVVVVSTLLLWTVCVCGDTKMDEADWIDPLDMLNFDPVAKKNIKRKESFAASQDTGPDKDTASTQTLPTSTPAPPPATATNPPTKKDESKIQEDPSLILMRRFVKSFLQHFNRVEPGGMGQEYNMLFYLTTGQFNVLQRFVESGNKKHVFDVEEILSHMTSQVYKSHLTKLDKTTLWIEEKLGISLQKLLQLASLVTLASVFAWVEMKTQLPWRRRVSQLIVLTFIISVIWTWRELYQQAMVKHQTVIMKDMPEECKEGGSFDYWSIATSWILLVEDKCEKYHEHLLIDPLMKVPPTKAVAVTAIRFFVAPLKDVGTAFGEFIKALLIDLPLTYHPVAICMVGMFLFLILFMMFGYRIRLPFFLSIEPAERVIVQALDETKMQAIQDTNNQVLLKLEEFQKRFESSESDMVDKLLELQRTQQAAIEYSMTSVPSSPVASPTIPSNSMPSASSPTVSCHGDGRHEDKHHNSSDSGTEILAEQSEGTVNSKVENISSLKT